MMTGRWAMRLMLAVAITSMSHAQVPVTPLGAGTVGNPYQINQLGHLVWMSGNVGSSNGKYYTLQNGIDASATMGWNGGAGFPPIGTNFSASFRGIFKGNGNAISGLRINRTNDENVGLFGFVRDGAVVENLVLSDCSVTGGWARGTNTNVGTVGGLVGDNRGTVTNCRMSGTVVVAGNFDASAGGLVGGSFGVVSECSAVGTVTGRDFVGGLVGWNFGTMNSCFTTVSVTGRYSVGGLAGDNFDGTLSNCYATGVVAGEGDVGGLIGHNFTQGAAVSWCYATGPVVGNYHVGGLVGNHWGGTVRNSHAAGDVTAIGDGSADAGGLVGWNGGTVSVCYATGEVTAPAGSDVGGLLGRNEWGGIVSECYATGSVMGSNCVGGLVGINYFGGTVTGCYSTGAVTGNINVGGLAGANLEAVVNSYWDTFASGRGLSAGGTGKTTAEMKQLATFAGWDFTAAWRIEENVTYPYFATPPRIETPQIYSGSSVILRWCSVSNHIYALCGSTNLLSEFSVIQGGIPATPPVNTYTVNVNGVRAKIWQITADP